MPIAHLVLLASALAGGPTPTLSIEGECAEPLAVEVAGLTPRGRYQILYSLEGEGSDTVPDGRCAGIRSDLSGVLYHNTRRADAAGTASLTPSIPEWACGATVQIVDITTCTPSNTALLGVAPPVCSDEAVLEVPADCPAECTGGCDGATCIIDCTAPSSCQVVPVTCAEDMNCEVRCWGDASCQVADVTCPTERGTCDVQCEGAASCELVEVFGGAGGLDVACDGISSCRVGAVTCGDGPCHSTCDGLTAFLGAHDCGDSCECSSSCL